MASSRWSALNESEKLAYYNLARERKKKYDDFVTNDQTEVDLTRSRNRQRKIEAILWYTYLYINLITNIQFYILDNELYLIIFLMFGSEGGYIYPVRE